MPTDPNRQMGNIPKRKCNWLTKMWENTNLTSNQKFITNNKLSFWKGQIWYLQKSHFGKWAASYKHLFAGDSATPRDVPGRNEASVSVNTGTQIFLEGLFIIAPNWKPGEWTRDTAPRWRVTGSKTKLLSHTIPHDTAGGSQSRLKADTEG